MNLSQTNLNPLFLVFFFFSPNFSIILAQISAPFLSAGESDTVPSIAATTGTGGGISDQNSRSCQLFSILQSEGGRTTPPGCSIPTSSITLPGNSQSSSSTSSSTPTSTSSAGNSSSSGSGISMTSIIPTSSSNTSTINPPNSTSTSNDSNAGNSINTRGPRGVGSAMPAVITGFLLLCALVYFLDELLDFLA